MVLRSSQTKANGMYFTAHERVLLTILYAYALLKHDGDVRRPPDNRLEPPTRTEPAPAPQGRAIGHDLAMYMSSRARPRFSSALARADAIGLGDRLGRRLRHERSTANACSACMPRTWSITSRVFWGEMPVYLVTARTSPSLTPYFRTVFFSLRTWPRKKRVGANSPSLCPTMFSAT